MTAMLADPITEAVAAARELLTRRTGASVTLVDPVDLGGSGRTVVIRVRVAENPFQLPRTLVIKQVRETSTESVSRTGLGAGDHTAFLREAVSYQFATALATHTRPGPSLIAYDLKERLLVLSDLGDAAPFTSLIANPDPSSVTNSLMALAQALGRMHAATFGREEDFGALLGRAGVADSRDGLADQVAVAQSDVPAMLAADLGIEVPPAVAAAVARAAKLFGSGGHRAFSPSDLCPDNIIVNDEGVRFLDYEWGGFRDATLDVAYTLLSYPGCLCRLDLTPERAEAMVDAWRAEVVGIWPHLADDDVLHAKLLDAQLVWAWLTTHWFLPDDDTRNAALRRHHLSVPRAAALTTRWSILSEYARFVGHHDLADFAGDVRQALAARWPAAAS
ncbi:MULTISPECIES: kinase [Nocardiaceae]|uniref:tRNA A-37 threonylcarbamoyl transferase component Bud32 n=1 Tax=Rhodococcoides corynebacterioides TaxID=53972 RepID=A0ABS2KRY6_9NOCA|nr:MULTISPECIES: kinase [Rhodococcus]MBM7414715.1 tRNA A-37 threonylcarbamoyl transferase component Bud32 [Rhodococcus corynebacterioides]MBP1117177.1 tRNA A-37 threonylcarbamoyl transferase component Bud32 [Rhodococcus sp. PvP016]